MFISSLGPQIPPLDCTLPNGLTFIATSRGDYCDIGDIGVASIIRRQISAIGLMVATLFTSRHESYSLDRPLLEQEYIQEARVEKVKKKNYYNEISI
ncbi:hypothetical protein PIIN_10957 [Serendipita indica DSM 11827]|uniref:Uncharacterized protein n=1 Tax=Serendipita indica (strain DSM 11827) TaxID=1109443 RepID=G4U081_SERID|nr:hypothetical protein PIIN_10957 [Serendipita indica DSM 11827]